MNQQIKYAILQLGSAEGFKIGSLVLRNQGETLLSQQEALLGLANDLLKIFKVSKQMSFPQYKCCIKNASSKYCSNCGSAIYHPDNISADEFKYWLSELLTLDLNDTYKFEIIDGIAWELGHPAYILMELKASEVLVIDESAETELCNVLGLK